MGHLVVMMVVQSEFQELPSTTTPISPYSMELTVFQFRLLIDWSKRSTKTFER